MENNDLILELDNKELKAIDGGKNLLEYIAYGVGYAVQELYEAAEVLAVDRPYGMY